MARVPAGTVAAQAQDRGIAGAEPLLVGLDCLLRYAEAYGSRFERPLNEDYVLRVPFLEAAKGFRGLLNGDGGEAMRIGLTTDSKDNGACVQLVAAYDASDPESSGSVDWSDIDRAVESARKAL